MQLKWIEMPLITTVVYTVYFNHRHKRVILFYASNVSKIPIIYIARNRGHFAPVINCQRNLVFKMADKNYRSQGKRIPCDFFNNLSSVDLFYEEKSWN